VSKTPHAAPDGAPPVGPYSPAVGVGGMLLLSGQLPLDANGELSATSAEGQADLVLRNMQSLLAAAGMDMDDVVKTTIFLTDMGDFATVNGVYARYFSKPFPARSTIQVAALPKGALVEIEAFAVADSG